MVYKDADRLGIRDKGTNLCLYGEAAEETLLTVVGEAGEGWYTVAYTPYWSEAELPGMKTLYEAAMKYRGRSPAEISRLWITGWSWK